MPENWRKEDVRHELNVARGQIDSLESELDKVHIAGDYVQEKVEKAVVALQTAQHQIGYLIINDHSHEAESLDEMLERLSTGACMALGMKKRGTA